MIDHLVGNTLRVSVYAANIAHLEGGQVTIIFKTTHPLLRGLTRKLHDPVLLMMPQPKPQPLCTWGEQHWRLDIWLGTKLSFLLRFFQLTNCLHSFLGSEHLTKGLLGPTPCLTLKSLQAFTLTGWHSDDLQEMGNRQHWESTSTTTNCT